MNNLIKFIFNKDYRFKVLSYRGFYKSMPDEVYLKRLYKALMGEELNLEHPRTLNEKLQWLKLYDRKPVYTMMVDKCEAKKYVASAVGEKYIIPTLGVWDKAEDIDFDMLPNQFVMKGTHDSHGLLICKDKAKLNIPRERKKFAAQLKRNYYYRYREWPYKNVKPRIIAEKYMDNGGQDLIDYKVHCFNGVPRIILVCADRFSDTGLTEDFFDCEWKHLPVKRPHRQNSEKPINKPEKLEEMLKISRILSEGSPFLRVDFYIIDGDLFFGELTFFPAGGFQKFEPESFDLEFGSYLTLLDE